MKVTGTLEGENVTIVDMDVNGLEIYATYIDSSNNLKVGKFAYNWTLSGTPVILSATSVA
jgi:hypothetical protein